MRKPTTKHVSTVPVVGAMGMPSDGEVREKTRFVRDLFKAEYAGARTAAEKRALARRLLKEGLATKDDVAGRYVLLRESVELAVAGGDAATVARGAEGLEASFGVDGVEMKVRSLGAAAGNCSSPEQAARLAEECAAAIVRAVELERYDEAMKLQGLAESAAARGKNVELAAAVRERRGQIEAMRKQAEAAKGAMEKLKDSPEDGEANLVAGRFLCLVKGDWEAGLPMLARSSDEQLKTLAAGELAKPTEAGALAQLAAGWWEYSGKQPEIARQRLQARAVGMYRQVVARLGGLSAQTAKKRLEEYEAERLRALNLSPGLNGEYFEGETLAKRRLVRVDPQVDFEWEKEPAEGMPKDRFSVRWSGKVWASEEGVYLFRVIANQGARLAIDDEVYIDRADMARKVKGEAANVRLSPGVHSVRIEFWDGTGDARCRLLWQPPGAAGEQVVPAGVLFHDELEVGGG